MNKFKHLSHSLKGKTIKHYIDFFEYFILVFTDNSYCLISSCENNISKNAVGAIEANELTDKMKKSIEESKKCNLIEIL
jgi:hypothetical protein